MSLSRMISLSLSSGVAVLLALSMPAAAQSNDHTPIVVQSSRHDVSAPMREILKHLPPTQPLGSEAEPFEIPNILLKPRITPNQAQVRYPGIQKAPTGVPAPTVDLAFEGLNLQQGCGGCLPPDTEGDIGDNEYIQWVNVNWAVFDKTTGALTSGPNPGNSFWTGFGGKCETTNSGDPLAVYDQRAHRWVMSQFVTSSPYAQCVAVSQTSDPLGIYDRYEFDWPANHFGDYGKLGVWTDASHTQDAYLLTTHEFTGSGSSFFGAAYIAFDRDAMLAGAPTANMVRFPNFDAYGVEPFNLIGANDAPANACPAFVHFDDTTGEYLFWNMCLDWTTPPYGTISAVPERIAGNSFTEYNNEVPQQGTPNGLDPFGTHVMYHAQVRAFPAGAPDPLSLVITHTVQSDADQAGISWEHFRLGNGGTIPPQPTGLQKQLVDEGVYAPDEMNRWLGSIAMDASGNIGVGYSLSSDTSHPQIQISGRSPSDAPGTLRDEQTCTDGIANGSQTSSSNRWGDYAAMNVDPTDQCTFYYTTEYYPITANVGWHTRVCSFKFDGCGDPDFALVSDTPARVEVCGATASGDPTWQLRAGIFNGFSGSVSLSGSSLPEGTTASFDPNPVTAPGQSLLTLDGGAALPSGQYAFNVDGTSGAITRSIGLELGVSAAAADAPELFAPTDTATGVKVRPKLVWGGNDGIFSDGFDGTPLPPPVTPGALSYTVEVATDPSFTNIVASATVTTSFWFVDVTLDPSTTYYWRVIPHNYCGDGGTSEIFSFTTGVPGVCPAGTTSTTVYEDDFESGINGWTAGGSGATGWSQGTAPAGTGFASTVWQVPDNGTTSDRTLVSPSITIPAGSSAVILSYDAFHNLETGGADSCYDNGSLALAEDGASEFGYLGPERMFTDPYTGVALSTTPLAGKQVWCHPGPATPTHSIVDLDDFSGHDVQIEFRVASDANSTATAPNGMIIDNFKVEVCHE